MGCCVCECSNARTNDDKLESRHQAIMGDPKLAIPKHQHQSPITKSQVPVTNTIIIEEEFFRKRFIFTLYIPNDVYDNGFTLEFDVYVLFDVLFSLAQSKSSRSPKALWINLYIAR